MILLQWTPQGTAIDKTPVNSQTDPTSELLCLFQIREIVEPIAGVLMQPELVAEIKRLKTIVDNLPCRDELKYIIAEWGEDVDGCVNAIFERIRKGAQ